MMECSVIPSERVKHFLLQSGWKGWWSSSCLDYDITCCSAPHLIRISSADKMSVFRRLLASVTLLFCGKNSMQSIRTCYSLLMFGKAVISLKRVVQSVYNLTQSFSIPSLSILCIRQEQNVNGKSHATYCKYTFTSSSMDSVGFEVLTAVVMKNSTFWDIMPCSPLKVNWCFGATGPLNLQVWRISQARNQREAGSKDFDTIYVDNKLH
jgi:hypothetical protein